MVLPSFLFTDSACIYFFQVICICAPPARLGLVVKNCLANAEDIKDVKFNPRVRKIPWKRKWQPTPVFLPGKSQGQKSLAGYSPWNHKELDTTEQLTTKHKALLDSDKPSWIQPIYKLFHSECYCFSSLMRLQFLEKLTVYTLSCLWLALQFWTHTHFQYS